MGTAPWNFIIKVHLKIKEMILSEWNCHYDKMITALSSLKVIAK